jgi:hypothetical protein
VANFQNNTAARSQLAGLIAKQPERWAEAESLLQETMTLFPDDVYSRNQLAELLAGQPDRRADAEALLRKTVYTFGDQHAWHQLIDMLAAQPDRQAEAEAMLRETTQKFPEDTGFRSRMIMWDAERSLDSGIGDACRLGAMRRLRFRLEHGAEEVRQAALGEVRRVLKEDPIFAYAEVLAARHHIWRAEANTLPPFAAAFEQALASADRAKLQELATRQPRLEALVLVAQAALGDAEAAAKIEEWLRVPDGGKTEPALLGLRARLQPVLRLIDGGQTAADSISAMRGTIIAALHDANESLLGEIILAA